MGKKPLVRASTAPLVSRYFLKPSFFASFSYNQLIITITLRDSFMLILIIRERGKTERKL